MRRTLACWAGDLLVIDTEGRRLAHFGNYDAKAAVVRAELRSLREYGVSGSTRVLRWALAPGTLDEDGKKAVDGTVGMLRKYAPGWVEPMEKRMRPLGAAGLEAWKRVDLRGRKEVEVTNHARTLEVLEELEALAVESGVRRDVEAMVRALKHRDKLLRGLAARRLRRILPSEAMGEKVNGASLKEWLEEHGDALAWNAAEDRYDLREER